MDRRSALKTLALAPLAGLLPKRAEAYRLDHCEILASQDTFRDAYAQLPMSMREMLERLRSVIFRPGVPVGTGYILVNPHLCTAMDLTHIQASRDWLASDDIRPGEIPPGARMAQWHGFVGMYFPRPWANAACWKMSEEWIGPVRSKFEVPAVSVYSVYADPAMEPHLVHFLEPGGTRTKWLGFEVDQFERGGHQVADWKPIFPDPPLDLYTVR